MVALVAGLCVQKPEGIEPTPLQPAEELKLSDFPEAFKDSTLIIVGDNTSDIEMQAVNEIADYLENETGNKPLIKKHSEISDEDKRNYNLIIVGTPKTNPLLEEVYAMTNATRVTEEFPGEGKGVLEILPNPWNKSKAMLLVEGWDECGIKISTIKIGEAKIYTNTRMIATLKYHEKMADDLEKFIILNPNELVELYVIVSGEVSPEKEKELKNCGATILFVSPTFQNRYTIKIPTNKISCIAKLSWIRYIEKKPEYIYEPPFRKHLRGDSK